MLYRDDPDGLIFIKQPAHAWISGQLARVWGNEEFGELYPREEVCLGAEQHDLGWHWWEMSPTLNAHTGRPYSFMELPRSEHLNIWILGVQLAQSFGNYPALLVSLHGSGLYANYNGSHDSPDVVAKVKDFLHQQHQIQAKLLSTLEVDPNYTNSVKPEIVARNRRLVTVWDWLSLAICMKVQTKKSLENVPTKIGETTLTLAAINNDPTQLTVDPWCFSEESVTLTFQGQRITKTFEDEEEMKKAIAHFPWTTIKTTLYPLKAH